jgi:hypothetical protein
VATNNGPRETPHASGDLPSSAPAMPSVPPDQIYRGTPYVLVEGLRHSLGWQDVRKTGASFVVTASRPGGRVKVLQRFPLSEQGWTDAWRALSRLDASAASAIEVKLAKLEAGRRASDALAALDASSLCYLRSVTFAGGSDRGSLTERQHYDLRFQDDRIMVCGQRLAHAFVELPYADVTAVEVSGPVNQPAGTVLGLISGLGLLGAFLGFLVLRLPGLLLGAVVLGLVGGFIAAVRSKNEAIVLVRGRDAEFQFLDPSKRPDDVRRALSEALMAIRKANAAQADGSNEPAEPTSDSAADQLSKLASLLQQDLISRDEFEQLKAKVIAAS